MKRASRRPPFPDHATLIALRLRGAELEGRLSSVGSDKESRDRVSPGAERSPHPLDAFPLTESLLFLQKRLSRA